MLQSEGLCLHCGVIPLCLQPFQLWCASAAMDAMTVAAAALAIATEHSRTAALQQVLLDRERAAMTAEDRGSLLAQRFFTGSTQVPRSMRPMTWKAAHRHVQNAVIGLREVMMLALRAIYNGNIERAEALLADDVESDMDVDQEQQETEAEDAP